MLRGLKDNFESKGYRVRTASDGEQGLAAALTENPDLVILDVMLPKINGYDICSQVRREKLDMPVIMLSARDREADVVRGLNIGADDYVTKPFSPKELVARVRAVLRRLPGERAPEEIKAGKLSMNLATHDAWFAGKPLNLTSIEFKLLGILAKEPGTVHSRTSLIEEGLGYDFEGFDRTIDVHILNLRRKLEPDPSRPKYIKTVYGVGYKFVGGEQ